MLPDSSCIHSPHYLSPGVLRFKLFLDHQALSEIITTFSSQITYYLSRSSKFTATPGVSWLLFVLMSSGTFQDLHIVHCTRLVRCFKETFQMHFWSANLPLYLGSGSVFFINIIILLMTCSQPVSDATFHFLRFLIPYLLFFLSCPFNKVEVISMLPIPAMLLLMLLLLLQQYTGNVLSNFQ